MKKNLIIFLFSILSITSYTQIINQEIIEFPDEDAQYIGGLDELQKFLSNNINYPFECVEKGIQGKVFVSFIVNTDGTISDVKVERGVHYLLDNEAMRVIDMMPPWKPAKVGNTVCRSKMRIPFTFSLDGDDNLTRKQARKQRKEAKKAAKN